MRYLILIIPLLLTGCNSSRAVTIQEWKANHPYAKEELAIPANPQSPESVAVYRFTDNFPRVTAAGVYSVERRVDHLTVDQMGNVLTVSRQ